MNLNFLQSSRFAAAATLRGILAGLLVVGAAAAAQQHLQATAVLAVLLIPLVFLDLLRSAGEADRQLTIFIEAAGIDGQQYPRVWRGLPNAAEAMVRAIDRMARARRELHVKLDQLEALIDNVAAALVAVDGTGKILRVNRAARQLGLGRGPLNESPALSARVAEHLLALPPGARAIVSMADGADCFVSSANFISHGERLVLLSFQGLSDQLDAVALKAWRDLVRVLAHEILNSLTPICSLSQALRTRIPAGTQQSDDFARSLEVIARRSEGLMHFVERYRQLIDVPELEISTVSACDLLDRLDRLMGPLMKDSDVDYRSVPPAKDFAFHADPDLLEQALINLLKNAYEAAVGRPSAAVRLATSREGGHVVWVVEDNGPGLGPTDSETAFIPFFTTKRSGFGIGLTLARQIALAHGGRLDYREAESGGAVFRLSMPFKRASGTPHPRAQGQ